MHKISQLVDAASLQSIDLPLLGNFSVPEGFSDKTKFLEFLCLLIQYISEEWDVGKRVRESTRFSCCCQRYFFDVKEMHSFQDVYGTQSPKCLGLFILWALLISWKPDARGAAS